MHRILCHKSSYMFGVFISSIRIKFDQPFSTIYEHVDNIVKGSNIQTSIPQLHPLVIITKKFRADGKIIENFFNTTLCRCCSHTAKFIAISYDYKVLRYVVHVLE